MKKIYYVLGLVVLSLVLGLSTCKWVDYHHNQVMNDSLNSKLQNLLGKDQGLTELIFRDLTGTVTYREIFDNCEKNVSNRSDVIVELRGLYPGMESRFRDTLSEFLSLENELMRSISLMSRNEMNYNYYSEEYYNTPGDWYYSNINRRLSNQMSEAKMNMCSSAKKAYEYYIRLDSMETSMLKLAKSNGIRMVSIYPKYLKLLDNWKYTAMSDEEKKKYILDKLKEYSDSVKSSKAKSVSK